MANPFKGFKNPGDDHLYFNWIEVATALIQFNDIHEGWWRVGIQFDSHGASTKIPVSKTQFQLVPSAFVSIINVNLRPVEEKDVDALCVNAAVVNPQSRIIMPANSFN